MAFIGAIRRICMAAVVASLAACASTEPANLSATDKTPGFNRAMHDFNVGVDRYFFRPASQGYDLVTPTLIKHLLTNGFSHLTLPADFVNFVLQGEIDPALETLGRFTINTVAGAGGLLDPATEFGLAKGETDFGLTLAKHGVPEGNYIVLPLLGPSTTRDAVGVVFDLAMHPVTYLGYVAPSVSPQLGLALTTVDLLDERSRNAALIDQLLYESEDSYVSLRSVYLQRRRALAAGEDSGADALPDIFNDSN